MYDWSHENMLYESNEIVANHINAVFHDSSQL